MKMGARSWARKQNGEGLVFFSLGRGRKLSLHEMRTECERSIRKKRCPILLHTPFFFCFWFRNAFVSFFCWRNLFFWRNAAKNCDHEKFARPNDEGVDPGGSFACLEWRKLIPFSVVSNFFCSAQALVGCVAKRFRSAQKRGMWGSSRGRSRRRRSRRRRKRKR